MNAIFRSRTDSIPTWILVFCSAMVLVGTAFSLALFFTPETLYAGIDMSASSSAGMIQALAGRTFAMALAVALAVYSRNALPLLIVLCMRFVTELQDLTTSFLTKGFVLFDVVFVGAFLVLEIAAIIKLASILKAPSQIQKAQA